ADLVDGRTYDGEIEPVFAADIAVIDLADMQADIGRRGRPALPRAAGIEGDDVLSKLMFGSQRGPPLGGHVVAGEHRQHAIANQLEHVAAGIMDGVDRSLRMIIEERNDL